MEKKFRPRLHMTKTGGNILMTQIRAETKNYMSKPEPIFLGTNRNESYQGKKTYKNVLYQTTCLYEDRSRSKSVSVSPAKSGKRVGYNVQSAR